MGTVFEEADLRAGLKDGGKLLGAFIIARAEDEFVVYIRANWKRGRGFRIIRTWRGTSGDRTFKNLQSAWLFIRKFGFLGQVMVFPLGDPDLKQFVGISAREFGYGDRFSERASSGQDAPGQDAPGPANEPNEAD